MGTEAPTSSYVGNCGLLELFTQIFVSCSHNNTHSQSQSKRPIDIPSHMKKDGWIDAKLYTVHTCIITLTNRKTLINHCNADTNDVIHVIHVNTRAHSRDPSDTPICIGVLWGKTTNARDKQVTLCPYSRMGRDAINSIAYLSYQIFCLDNVNDNFSPSVWGCCRDPSL